MDFGDRLIELRKLKKMNRKELSRRSEISYIQVSNYEEGKSNPTITALRKLSKALEVSPRAFFPDQRFEAENKIRRILENSLLSDDQILSITGQMEQMIAS